MSKDKKFFCVESTPVAERVFDELYTIVHSIDRLADDQQGEKDPAGADVRVHQAISSFERSYSRLSDLELEVSLLTPAPFREELRSLLVNAKSLVQLIEPVLENLLNEAELPSSKFFDLVLIGARTLKGTTHTKPQNRMKRLKEKGLTLMRRASNLLEKISNA